MHKKTAIAALFCAVFLIGCFAQTAFAQTKSERVGELIGEISDIVRRNYLYGVSEEELYSGAAYGLALALDEYSSYLPPLALGEFIGVINRSTDARPAVACGKLRAILPGADESAGYIALRILSENSARDFKAAVDYLKRLGVTKLVLDLRDNPGGLLYEAVDVCAAVVPKGLITRTIDKNGKKTEYFSSLEESPFQKITALVNKNSASAAELIASALQDAGAIAVGETTYGKGVVQELFIFPAGDGMTITTMEYFRRNGEKINGIGVAPDIECEQPLLKAYELLID